MVERVASIVRQVGLREDWVGTEWHQIIKSQQEQEQEDEMRLSAQFPQNLILPSGTSAAVI
jgi:hypothetical protein